MKDPSLFHPMIYHGCFSKCSYHDEDYFFAFSYSKTYIFPIKCFFEMSRDQGIGALLLFGSIVGLILYFWLVFLSTWSMFILQLTAFAAVGFVLAIMAWIGYTLATTPPPKPIEEIEKEAETGETPPPQPQQIEEPEVREEKGKEPPPPSSQ